MVTNSPADWTVGPPVRYASLELKMDTDPASSELSRRDLLRMIGATAGGAAMYQAMRTNRYETKVAAKQVAALPHPTAETPP
jgi:hypothetical protein